jgi:hypothetical protein
MSNSCPAVNCECGSPIIDTNTVLLILDLVLTTMSTIILGLRCKMRMTPRGFTASVRPQNSEPSPPSACDTPELNRTVSLVNIATVKAASSLPIISRTFPLDKATMENSKV